MSININDLSDAELASCVDLYIVRVMQKMSALEFDNYVNIEIRCPVNNPQDELTVTHHMSVQYNNTKKWEGNNLFIGATVLRERVDADKVHEPKKYRPALPAPTPIDYTPFEEVAVDDGVPF